MAAAAQPLTASDAVAALIRFDDGRLLLQQRDARDGIWFPSTWGCFGGAVNPGEQPLAALRRELAEELEFRPREAIYFTRFDFDFAPLGMRSCYRIYYTVPMNEHEFRRLVLHEGQAFGTFSVEELRGVLPLTPYDAFAIELLRQREASRVTSRETDR